MTTEVYSTRRNPQVLIRLNGEPAEEIQNRRIAFQFIDRIYKRDEARLTLSDYDGAIKNKTLLSPDDIFEISWGYPGNMSRARSFRLKTWEYNFDTEIPSAVLKLTISSRKPDFRGKNKRQSTEPHRLQRPKNWGQRNTSDIAKAIARRHRLKFKGDKSDDIDDVDFIQPGNLSDYGFLQQLAEDIDFEFFIEDDTLFYRKKPYGERPRRVLFYAPMGSGNSDTLLYRFRPVVKVAKVSTKPRGSNTKTGDAKTSAEKKVAAINKELNSLVTDQQLAAEDLDRRRTELLKSIADDANKQSVEDSAGGSAFDNIEEGRKSVEEALADVQRLKSDLLSRKKEIGRQTANQKTESVNKKVKTAENCSAPKKPGSSPTGDAQDIKNSVSDTKLQLGVDDPRTSKWIGGTETSVVTPASNSRRQSKIACASHSKMMDRVVAGEAECIGDPELRAKVNYELRNIGTRFNGSWYTKEAIHTVTETYSVRLVLKRGTVNKVKKNKGTKTGAAKSKPEAPRKNMLELSVNDDRVARVVQDTQVSAT